jgi:hypothetical protein
MPAVDRVAVHVANAREEGLRAREVRDMPDPPLACDVYDLRSSTKIPTVMVPGSSPRSAFEVAPESPSASSFLRS